MVKVFYVAGITRNGQTLMYNQIQSCFKKVLRKDNSNFSLETGAYPFKVNGKETQNKIFNYDVNNFDCVILSEQNFIFDNDNIQELIQKTKNIRNIKSHEIFFLQLFRNPLNHVASIVKVFERKSPQYFYDKNFPELIKQNFENMEKLKLNENKNINFFYLNYDEFVDNIEYRKTFFDFTNASYKHYYRFEKSLKTDYGSSFSKFSVVHLKMKREKLTTTYNTRYKHFVNNEIYLKALSSIDNVIEIVRKHFKFDEEDLIYFSQKIEELRN